MISTAIRQRPHRLWFQNPGPPIIDPDGGYTLTWTDLEPPALWAHMEPATTASLERVTSGAVLGIATHLISVPFHPAIALKTRALFEGRIFEVADVKDREFLKQELTLVVVEVLPQSAPTVAAAPAETTEPAPVAPPQAPRRKRKKAR